MCRLFTFDRSLIAVAGAWLAVLWLTPSLLATEAAFGGSVLLIAVNAGVSLWRLTVKRSLLIGLNCAQIVLFGTLSHQLFAVFGEHHYRYTREKLVAEG